MGKRAFYTVRNDPNGLAVGDFSRVIAASEGEAIAMCGIFDHGATGQVYAHVWGGGEKVLYRYVSGQREPDKIPLSAWWGGDS
jgi:hypothetical protein